MRVALDIASDVAQCNVWLKEFEESYQDSYKKLDQILERIARGDLKAIGDHDFELPYANLRIRVTYRNIFDRLAAVFS